tara:strand:- start:23 stop:439 length:417 start_codon:yes stop_codon:yes gene_type:complete
VNNVSIPEQESLETSVLCILYEAANGRNHFSSVEHVASNFRPPVEPARIRIALESLAERGLSRASAMSPQGAEITRQGIDWIENEFAMNTEGEIFQFRRKRRPSPLPPADKKSVDWSKWGAILTGLGIIVATLIAVMI